MGGLRVGGLEVCRATRKGSEGELEEIIGRVGMRRVVVDGVFLHLP